jgi:hypothetical protein
VEVSSKVCGVDPVGEDKYLAARGCVSMCVSTVDCLFYRGFEFVSFVFR